MKVISRSPEGFRRRLAAYEDSLSHSTIAFLFNCSWISRLKKECFVDGTHPPALSMFPPTISIVINILADTDNYASTEKKIDREGAEPNTYVTSSALYLLVRSLKSTVLQKIHRFGNQKSGRNTSYGRFIMLISGRLRLRKLEV